MSRVLLITLIGSLSVACIISACKPKAAGMAGASNGIKNVGTDTEEVESLFKLTGDHQLVYKDYEKKIKYYADRDAVKEKLRIKGLGASDTATCLNELFAHVDGLSFSTLAAVKCDEHLIGCHEGNGIDQDCVYRMKKWGLENIAAAIIASKNKEEALSDVEIAAYQKLKKSESFSSQNNITSETEAKKIPCDAYAKRAVEQVRLFFTCTPVPSNYNKAQWVEGYDNHFRWCMSMGKDSMYKVKLEEGYRDDFLAQCGLKN